MKNKILAIIILTMLVLPVSVQAVPDIEPVDTVQENEVIQPAITKGTQNVLPPEDLDPNSFPHKQPVSKKQIAKKFLLAMGGVAASSIIIFLTLTLYNKVREGFAGSAKTPDGEVSLETPDDLQGAVKAFLNKTDWK